MQELNSRQMFCTHCGEGLVDRQGKPAVQVKNEILEFSRLELEALLNVLQNVTLIG